ncbi:MAG TPA: NlpC/P60 family protein [Candidatus Limnocylindrales bacterium]
MGFRVTVSRATAIATLIAVVGVAVPAALVAATPSAPVTLASAVFSTVVVPASTGGATLSSRLARADGPARSSRIPSTELRDDAAATAGAAAVLARAATRTRTSNLHAGAVASVVRHVATTKAASPARSSSAVTFAAGSSAARNRVVRIALAQLNDRYVAGGTGPDAFDCSGLVRYAYKQAGVGGELGGGHSASAMLAWGRSMGLTSRTNGRVGDVVIYGDGSHAGIYIGNGKIVSALNPSQGIRVTGLYALGAPFTAFIHTRI